MDKRKYIHPHLLQVILEEEEMLSLSTHVGLGEGGDTGDAGITSGDVKAESVWDEVWNSDKYKMDRD